jgi:hypothetical protein
MPNTYSRGLLGRSFGAENENKVFTDLPAFLSYDVFRLVSLYFCDCRLLPNVNNSF